MDKKLVIERLISVKLLYTIGLEQSKWPLSTSYVAVLTFHDAVEILINLIVEDRDIKVSKDIQFLQYWEKTPDLPFKESMSKLNLIRTSLKHKGIIPSVQNILSAEVYVTDFIYQCAIQFFNVDFNDVTLFDLIECADTKNHLITAQKCLNDGRYMDCVGEVTLAFYKLIDQYKDSKKDVLDKSEFKFIERINYYSIFGSDLEKIQGFNEVKELFQKIDVNFGKVSKALEILTLGIDYRKFAKFRILTPPVLQDSDYKTYALMEMKNRNWNLENCQFLLDFVTESSLKLQDFNFSYESLAENEI